uniref:Uncharacterized protein n=1 Tax=Candidatus Kentrum sp. TC TaxID=2126339 RepID=A0A450YN38_9GAMM|nr:MAG: hypothetical protein BECKTC1821D_GA0114238_101427 [Candidatus Kentron sp. TC]VFK42938.1 MAG: hypothetical protein BECKTC1821E_GA0114239_102221 [Candidatus Kentron sp. TC]VFK57278.1 MAG: hypothetical protein BECKTC1821F_GA0114240_101628 [Candidatus Kentron sp. TC]
MKDSKYYAEIGMRAARRAARKVVEQAHRDNKPMPVWNGERVEYIIPPLPDQEDRPLEPLPIPSRRPSDSRTP